MLTVNEIKSILENSKTIAVVGCSKNTEKAANRIPAFLQSKGYKIIPINPTADEILGEKCYKNLNEITEQVDIIDVFRPENETPKIVEEAIKLKPKLIWLQLDIENSEAEQIAINANIPIVMDHCIKIEYSRLLE